MDCGDNANAVALPDLGVPEHYEDDDVHHSDAWFRKLAADNCWTQATINQVLDSRKNGFNLDKVSYSCAKDIVQYLTAVLPEAERWGCVNIAISDTESVNFWKRDIIACIVKMYGSVAHGTNFNYSGDPSHAKSEPHGTSVWLREEAHVRIILGSHAFMAAVQLYADATVVNLKGGSVHPV
ncbi:hypothetical protein DUNSADRAFT_9227 [Dunaliella salina]|uniref:Uncharacterized protein n=1 Tax=Dunaliella salina TaxID=3046 RepID=A0ABQ7GHX9_DUNSA|nr:hypothetical protein DUNSADRAFT_9227 [Dunaliella salina]|eukprot:KAF5834197.1 hypothetical protein DUNSADRAFT_9227 [Dunaliella salina]